MVRRSLIVMDEVGYGHTLYVPRAREKVELGVKGRRYALVVTVCALYVSGTVRFTSVVAEVTRSK